MDGEILLHLYDSFGIHKMASLLDGVFAFILLDTASRKVFLGRDTYGVRPLFKLNSDDGFLAVCSEAKGNLIMILWISIFPAQFFLIAYPVVFAIKGLIEVSNAMDSPASLVAFLPGHVEVYNLQENGKVQSIQMEQFHSCTKEPAHAIYDTVAKLPTGLTVSLESCLLIIIKKIQ